MVFPSRTKRVLKWVNKNREARGLAPLDDLLPGFTAVPSSCPIAASLKNGERVHVYTSTYSIGFATGVLPSYVSKWIKKFDNGQYREYNR